MSSKPRCAAPANAADIIKTMHRELTGKGLARSTADWVIHDRAGEPVQSLVGRVVARGLADEINDRHYMIVDAVDGKSHWIDIGRGEATEPTPPAASCMSQKWSRRSGFGWLSIQRLCPRRSGAKLQKCQGCKAADAQALKKQGHALRVMITDKLGSSAVAGIEILSEVEHHRHNVA